MGNSNNNKISDDINIDNHTDLDSTNDLNTIVDLDIEDNYDSDTVNDTYKDIKNNLEGKSFLDDKTLLNIKSNLQNVVDVNEDNEQKYKLTVEEKINTSSEYEKEKGIYLEVSGGRGHTKIYKNMFKRLCSYKLIIELYESCLKGLKLQPIEYCFLTWFDRMTVSQTMVFDETGILKINDSNYNFGHGSSTIWLEINNINRESFFFMLEWIKKSLEELHPELKEGFVYIMCGYIQNKNNSYDKKPLQMDKKFQNIFKKVYGDKYIQDEYLGIKSKSRQDERVFNLIKELKLEEAKVRICKIPKFMLPYCEIDFCRNYYGEKIKINCELLFYCKFYKLNEEIKKHHIFSNDLAYKYKSEKFDILQNFDNLINGLDWGFGSDSFIELN